MSSGAQTGPKENTRRARGKNVGRRQQKKKKKRPGEHFRENTARHAKGKGLGRTQQEDRTAEGGLSGNGQG